MAAVPTITELGGQIHLLAETMEKDAGFNWTAFNPSILRHGDKTYVTVRSSNYEILENGVHRLLGYGDIINKVWLCELTKDLKLVNQRLLNQEHLEMKRGLEDARLHHDEHGNIRMYAIGLEKWIPRARVVECALDPELTEITGVRVLPGIHEESIEKNWAAPSGVDANFDYWHSPGVVYVDGMFKNVDNKCEVPVGLRGSTPFIEYGENLIAVMHVTLELRVGKEYDGATFAYRKFSKRKYTHYFVITNKNGEILKVSDPFRFKIEGVEFAAGIMKTRDGYAVTYGAGDRIARLAVIPKTTVTTLLGEVQ